MAEKILKVKDGDLKKSYLLINFGNGLLNVTLANYDEKNREIKVLGNEAVETKDLNDGIIKNMENVEHHLRQSINGLKEMAGQPDFSNEKFEVICTIANSLGERVSSQGVLNFINNEITEENIDKLIQLAIYNSNIPNEIKTINYKAVDFRVDDVSMSNPVNMSGKKLEVNLELQTIDRNHYNNFKKVLAGCGLNISFIHFDTDNILDAILEEEDMDYGSILLEFGLTNSKLMFVKKNKVVKSLRISDSANSIISKIAKKYNFKHLEAQKIYEKIDFIIDYSSERGFFEVEKASMEIESIKIKDLEELINSGLEKVFKSIKETISRNIESTKYKNGIVIVNNSNFTQDMDKIIQTVFSNDIITLKSNDQILTSDDKVVGAEKLKGKFDIYGDVKFINKHESYQFDYENNRFPKTLRGTNVKKMGKLDLDHLREFGSEREEEPKPTMAQKIKKTIIDLW